MKSFFSFFLSLFLFFFIISFIYLFFLLRNWSTTTENEMRIVILKILIVYGKKINLSFQKKLPLVDLSTDTFCDEPVQPPVIEGAAAAVARGNCTFSTKASLVQKYGGEMLLTISKTGLVRMTVLICFPHRYFSSRVNNLRIALDDVIIRTSK